MPRGDNPNSKANLKPVRTKKEARERGSKGGKASGRTRRIHRTFKEIDLETTTDEDLEEVLRRVVTMMKHGNLNAIKTYMEMTGMNNASEDDSYEDDGLLEALKAGANKLVDDMDMIKKDGDEDGETESAVQVGS